MVIQPRSALKTIRPRASGRRVRQWLALLGEAGYASPESKQAVWLRWDFVLLHRRSRCGHPAAGALLRDTARNAAELDVLRDDAIVTVIGSGTSLEGDRWVLATDGDEGDPIT